MAETVELRMISEDVASSADNRVRAFRLKRGHRLDITFRWKKAMEIYVEGVCGDEIALVVALAKPMVFDDGE